MLDSSPVGTASRPSLPPERELPLPDGEAFSQPPRRESLASSCKTASSVRSARPIRSSPASSVPPDGKFRRSAFKEIGLGDFSYDNVGAVKEITRMKPPRPRGVRFRSKLPIHDADQLRDDDDGMAEWVNEDEGDLDCETIGATCPGASPPSSPFPTMSRLILFAFVFALIIPTLHNPPWIGKAGALAGAKMGIVRNSARGRGMPLGKSVKKRDDSPTDVCKRWSQQAAVVNGTMYLYGGRVTMDASQTENTWSTFRPNTS